MVLLKANFVVSLASNLFFFYLLCLKIGLICFTYENVYEFFFSYEMLYLLLLALIALFFKAYAVEADIRLLAFYLHLPDRKGFALFGMNSQRLDPGSLVEWRLL